MGLMFNKIIPFDILVQLPRPFVHRLRDIRMKQLEEMNKQQQTQSGKNIISPMNETAIDDLIDELT